MSELIVTRHGRVLQLTLNRPAARNALNNALLTQIAEQLEAAAADAEIAVCVIYGNERCFAAGADLNEMAEKDLPATLNDIRPQLWARINAFTKPLIAAVNGYALGAGCELALLCDVVIAGDNARFGLPEITLGIMPGAGGTQRLIRSVGKWRATRRWRYRRRSRRFASRRKCRFRPGWRRSVSCLRYSRPPTIAGKASTPFYRNAPQTLKDANCGIYSEPC